MPTTTQDHIEVQELVFPAAGERREPGGRPERPQPRRGPARADGRPGGKCRWCWSSCAGPILRASVVAMA